MRPHSESPSVRVANRNKGPLTIALLSLFPAERQDVTAVTAPIGTHVGKVLEAMGNAVVELGLVWVGFGVGLSDALGNNLGVTLLVARVVAVRTLHTGGVLEKFTTERTTHDVVELLLDELVSVLLDDIFFALTNGTFTTKTKIEGLLVAGVFGEGHGKVDATYRLQREPVVNHNGPCLRLGTARSRASRARTSSTGACKVLPWWRLELHVGLNAGCSSSHLVGSHPARVCELCLDLLSSHFFSDV